VLGQHHQDLRQPPGAPLLEEAVAVVLSAARRAFRVRVGRRLAERAEAGGKVPLEVRHRVALRRALVEAGRHQHDRVQHHLAAPEGREPRTLDAHAPHVLRVGRHRNRGDHLAELECHRALAVEDHLLGLAVEVAGAAAPVLALAVVERELEHVAVRALHRLVDVEHGLDVVRPGGELAQAAERLAGRLCVDADGSPGLQPGDVDAEDLLRVPAPAHLRARLALELRGDDQDQPPAHRLAACGGAQPDVEARPGRRRGLQPSRAAQHHKARRRPAPTPAFHLGPPGTRQECTGERTPRSTTSDALRTRRDRPPPLVI
jgi:hypothetical protein